MKGRWTTFVKDYLTFTVKDRIGMLLLLILLVGVYLYPNFYRRQPQPVDTALINQELQGLRIYIDSSRSTSSYRNDDDYDFEYRPSRKNYHTKNESAKGELFEFDPNTLDAQGWKRLGLRDRTIETIMKFTGKGYKFRKPEDIKRIYGLRSEDADRLIPYIKITAEGNTPNAVSFASSTISTKPSVTAPRVIDVNLADTSALIALPGIGSKLAARIVSFREKLGGFISINQVGETYALPDSTFQKIKGRLACANPQLKTININTADVNALKAHPYLRWNLANAIVAYRQQHGDFRNVDDLKKINIITDDVYQKAAPYLTVGSN